MARNTFLLLIITFTFACKNDSQKEAISTEENNGAENTNTQISIAGNWINEKYYDNIISNKSPREAQKSCEVCLIKIPSNTNHPAQIILNFHEAMEDLAVVKAENNLQLWDTEQRKPTRMIDTILIIGDQKIKIGQNTFVRIKPVEQSNEYMILEQLLFKGVYMTEEGSAIEFMKNGKVTGLGDFNYYEPIIDYNDIARDVDQVLLGKTKDEMKAFAFKYKNKKLQIFALKCKSSDHDGTCIEVGFGKRLYNIKKVK